MKIGAISTSASEEIINLFELLGDKLGMIFQLRDDIFDYFKQEIGKPTGNDVREGKITLPLIYSLNNSTDMQSKSKAYDIINKFNFSDENIEFLVNFAITSGGIDYAYEVMNRYKKEAEGLISKLDDCFVKDSLQDLVNYLIKRKY